MAKNASPGLMVRLSIDIPLAASGNTPERRAAMAAAM